MEPFLRGVAWPAAAGIPYPRADPADARRLPADTWSAAQVPAGVRLEASGDASHLRVGYLTATSDPAPRGAAAGTTFALWRNGQLVDEVGAETGAGTARLRLGAGPGPAVVYLPEGMKPLVTEVAAECGTVEPGPRKPRWVAYGDSIAEGWNATSPAAGWVATVGRHADLDAVNLGYAGAARGEIVSAEHIARIPADVISLTHGTNCWSMVPHSTAMMRASTAAFLRILRAGHPGVPIVVASPLVRPDAEDRPNRLGATLGDLRRAMEDAVSSSGDELIMLVDGRSLLDAAHLTDGVHPGDAGHRALADRLGPMILAALTGTSAARHGGSR